jgi:predicted RNA-binding Zn-ribbon protein involved in translation (DUF1610 family)
MNNKDIEGEEAVDISDIDVQVTDNVCPYCGVIMLPLHHTYEAVSPEVQCPSCGYMLNPNTTDQARHTSRLTPKITQEMIADEDENTIFETVDEDSGRDEDEEEIDDFAEDDRRDEESLRRKGYKILSSS